MLDQEEVFWAEKAKLEWRHSGDRNTAYFHLIATVKHSRNVILMLKNGCHFVTEQDDMDDIVVNYFTNLFCFTCQNINTYVIDDVIPNLVTTNMNNILTSLPFNEEIWCDVFSFNKNSALGPDGFRGIFFHTFWDIIQHDMCAIVLQFFKHG